ncbi:MAG: hypothetical protein L6R41_008320 [Letrouitia leprolyta]|nr:MAG: hypothetical protein L6R41_008320 [Letrouitia leprolyta]
MAPAPPTSTNAARDEPTEIESPKSTRHGMFSPIRDVLRSPSSSEPKPEKAKQAKHRMPIDDFDSSSDTEDPLEPQSHTPEERSTQPQHVESDRDRLSESPVQVSPQEQPQARHPPGLMIDTSSQDDPSTSPVSPLSSSAELIEAPNEGNARDGTPASTAQSSGNTSSWSDAHLRAYLEDDSEVRDLLLVVHNKVDVKPAPRDHPLVKNLFKEENRKLGEMSNRLDSLLGDWLARKSKKEGELTVLAGFEAVPTSYLLAAKPRLIIPDTGIMFVSCGISRLILGGFGDDSEPNPKTSNSTLNNFTSCNWVGSSNNYAYLVTDEASKDAVIIDPANPPEVAPVLKDAIDSGKINLTAIVNTHQQPGHEYTKQNVKFLTTVLNTEPVRKLQAFAENNQQTQGKFTIGDEKQYNVFMRVTDPAVQKATGKTDPVDVMGKLREMKNNM